MESFQYYYLHKDNKNNIKKYNKEYDEVAMNAILWANESLRRLLYNSDIQAKILLHYFPQCKENIQHMRTFDSIDEYKIKSYIEDIVGNNTISGIIVIMITNHQIILIEKTLQDVYIIDPTSMLRVKSIHNISYLENQILPIFQQNKYNIEYVQLSYPAQMTREDHYSNSWLFYLLIQCLEQMYHFHTISIITIPDKIQEKHKILSNFHKELLYNNSIKNELTTLFLEFVNDNIHLFSSIEYLEMILNIDPCEIISKYTM